MIYGVEVTAKMILIAMGKDVNDDTYVDDFYEFAEMTNEWLKSKGFTCQCHHLRCCAWKSNHLFYVGQNLGDIYTAYRTYVETHDDFNGFHTFIANMLQKTKNMYEQHGTVVSDNLKELFPTEPIKIYTFANDCDRCS